MTMIVCDAYEQKRLIAQRKRRGHDRYDEVWEGVYVMSPQPNIEHQDLGSDLRDLLKEIVRPEGGKVHAGVNVSDRVQGGKKNYRVPDVAAYFKDNPAQDCGTHYCGGPDWAAEIISRGDRARKKLEFYAKVGVREMLIIDRKPWALELYVLKRKKLKLVGACSLEEPAVLASTVFPVTFTLVAGEPRPLLEVTTPVGASPRRM